MKVIKYIEAGEVIQLGFEGKILFLKWGDMPMPMRVGKLLEIKQMSSQSKVSLGKESVNIPLIIKEMSKAITWKGIEDSERYTEEEFYNDFLKDYKEMSEEGLINFIGEFNKWH